MKLLANMKEDARLGLLKSSAVYGYSEKEKGTDTFIVSAKEKKEYHVYFIGDFGGNKKKMDRNLPSIDIVRD